MSASTHSTPKSEYRLHGPWANAWKIAAGIGALGLAGAGAGFAQDAHRFAFSYLYAFVFFLLLALGAAFFVLVQHVTSAGWSVTVRRTAEFFVAGLPAFALLFLPILASMNQLFPWYASPGTGDHAAAHASADGHAGAAHEAGHAAPAHAGAAPAAEAATTEEAKAHEQAALASAHSDETIYPQIEADEHHHLLHKKHAYLNFPFFLIRALLYFGFWTFLAYRLLGLSAAQDKSKDPSITPRLARISAVSLPLFGLSLTFAVFDWVMSLLPSWYSTIFGVWMFAGGVVSFFACVIVITLALKRAGVLDDAVLNTEHYHDLGKLLFGFNVFWAYIAFSQFFLIWYAGIPEETEFFHLRWVGDSWKTVGLTIVLLHFVLPFLFLLSRNIKRRVGLLALGACLLFTIQIVEAYWAVLPNLHAHGEVSQLSFHWLDIACLLGVGGAYFAVVFNLMTRHSLIPSGDPRLQRALDFQNA